MFDVIRTNGETGREERIDGGMTAEQARARADQAKQDGKIARPGNSDSYSVRER